MSRQLLVRGGTVVAMDPARRVLRADVLVTDGRIAAIGPGLQAPPGAQTLDASGMHVLPGFVQGHVHLGQSLFRGLAEDRELLSWLRDRIWPLEAAHDEETAYASGLLGALDCLLSGTTTIQEMGLVRGMEGIFRAIQDSGIRAVAGKCLMDTGDGVPARLLEDTKSSLAEARDLAKRWHGVSGGRIRAAVCPRFLLTGSRKLWEGTAALASDLRIPVHTHLLESEQEGTAIRNALGMGEMEFLDAVGILDTDLRVAHGVWIQDEHVFALRGRPLKVIHCPSANLKLGSGVADLVYLRSHANLSVGLGCDGAACNNDLDVLEEIRLAALLQGGKHGPGRFSSMEALELATVEGARAVGWEDAIGSLETGKLGDLVVLDLETPRSFGPEGVSVYDRVVYGAARENIRWVVVEGKVVVENGTTPFLDAARVMATATDSVRSLLRRSGLS